MNMKNAKGTKGKRGTKHTCSCMRNTGVLRVQGVQEVQWYETARRHDKCEQYERYEGYEGTRGTTGMRGTKIFHWCTNFHVSSLRSRIFQTFFCVIFCFFLLHHPIFFNVIWQACRTRSVSLGNGIENVEWMRKRTRKDQRTSFLWATKMRLPQTGLKMVPCISMLLVIPNLPKKCQDVQIWKKQFEPYIYLAYLRSYCYFKIVKCIEMY